MQEKFETEFEVQIRKATVYVVAYAWAEYGDIVRTDFVAMIDDADVTDLLTDDDIEKINSMIEPALIIEYSESK